MKSKGAFVPHSDHGVAKKSFFNSNHHNRSSSSSNSNRNIDSDESEHHQLYHHHSHSHTSHDRSTGRWFEPLSKGFIPFAQKQQRATFQPVMIFIAWCLVLAITSTSLIDCVYAGADTTGDVASKSAFGSASLPVFNLGPEITTEFGEYLLPFYFLIHKKQ